MVKARAIHEGVALVAYAVADKFGCDRNLAQAFNDLGFKSIDRQVAQRIGRGRLNTQIEGALYFAQHLHGCEDTICGRFLALSDGVASIPRVAHYVVTSDQDVGGYALRAMGCSTLSMAY